MTIGRPSDYDPDIATVICERIANGESIRAICASKGMPSHTTVYRWIDAHDEFRSQYARAREDQAERYASELIEIAESVDTSNRVAIEAAKLRIDTRKWVASKLLPKVYGDRISQDVTIAGMSDVLREASAMLDQAKAKR